MVVRRFDERERGAREHEIGVGECEFRKLLPVGEGTFVFGQDCPRERKEPVRYASPGDFDEARGRPAAELALFFPLSFRQDDAQF